ncbi:MAG: N-formylglutamate deformylase [Pseudomonadota bacterium]
MTPIEITRGDGPIVLGMPHTGTWLPDDVRGRLNARGSALADTDWHIDQLYDGLLPDATIVRATFHRYLIDANRDPAGASLYPGQNTTGLVPFTDFDGEPIWTDEPDADEIERRLTAYHAPYHATLQGELDRVKSQHGVAILFDCHSIRSVIPNLFEGELPILNIGTNDGTTCASYLDNIVYGLSELSPFNAVLNGRFKGGWTTRNHGRPTANIHAIQMEIAQRAYLNEEAPPWTFDAQKAEILRPVLRDILTALDAETETLARGF